MTTALYTLHYVFLAMGHTELTTTRLQHAIIHFSNRATHPVYISFSFLPPSSPTPVRKGHEPDLVIYCTLPRLDSCTKKCNKNPKNSHWSYLLWAAGEWHAAVRTRANRASWAPAAGRRTGGSNSRAANALARLSEARSMGRYFAFAAALTHGFDGLAHHLYSEPIKIWYYVECISKFFRLSDM